MHPSPASTERTDPTGGYVVGLPRVTDAMGAALRAAFGGEGGVPEDMRVCIAALDRHPRNA